MVIILGYDYVYEKSTAITRKYDTDNPFKLAKELGIFVLFQKDFKKLKGMYKVILRNRFIFINANIPYEMQKIVCAHEIGHDQLHREFAVSNALHETSLFKINTKMEYEANLFASEILLSDEDVITYLSDGYSVENVASLLSTDVNLVALKVNTLISQGYDLRSMEHKSNFLKYSE